MKKKTKVAIIGVGRWGKVLLKEFSQQAEILYTSTRTLNNTTEALSDDRVEAVVIATPTETHLDIASRALEAGKHVFLEKPGTTDSEDLEKLVRMAEERNLKLAIGYEFTHHPAARKIKELIENREITALYFDWFKWGTFNDDARPHLLSHEISIMKYLGIDNLSPISHRAIRVISDTDIMETEFKNNQNIYIKSIINRVNSDKQKIVTVILENGGYIWSNSELFSINTASRELEKIELPETTPMAAEITDFLSAIREHRDPLTSGRFGVEVFKIVEQVENFSG